MKELIKTLIKEFQERTLPKIIERETQIPLNTNKIISIIGPRRAGKTFLLLQTIKKIKDKKSIIYLNFEDERLELNKNNLDLIIQAYYELYPEQKEIYFFFDEIQEIPDWQKFVRRIHDTISKNIFITGSSAKLLSKEIATSLRGRTITYEVLPFNFKEFLKIKNITPETNTTKGRAIIKNAFEEFMNKGSFPETINQEEIIREKTLRNYLDVMIYKDLIERHNIKNSLATKKLIIKLLSQTAKEFTINKIYNSLKSEGISTSKDSLYEQIILIQDAYIAIILEQIKPKTTIKKIYSIDTGLSKLTSQTLSKELGRLLETTIFLELKKQEKEIYYHKEEHECDFIIKEKEQIMKAIQVCYKLTEENQEREIKGLKEAMKKYNLKEGTIITLDQEKTIENIKIIPAWKFLINQ